MVICVRPDTVVVVGQKPFVGGGGGPAAFSDDFSGTLAAWTEAINDSEINGGTYRIVTGSFNVVACVHNTSTGTTTQYVKVTLGVNGQYPWVMFRYTDASSGYYAVQIDGNNGAVDWYYFSNDADTSGDLIQSGTFGSTVNSSTVGFTIDGTGTSTRVRGWKSPTNLPTTSSNWDGDTTPEVDLTNDPATPLNTGTKVGIGGQQGTASLVTLDNFFGGGL
jgi:hypothetical protein